MTDPCIWALSPRKGSADLPVDEVQPREQVPVLKVPAPIRIWSSAWMLERSWPIEKIAVRVNANPKTIRKHYDKTSLDERRQHQRDPMQDRRDLVDDLDLPT